MSRSAKIVAGLVVVAIAAGAAWHYRPWTVRTGGETTASGGPVGGPMGGAPGAARRGAASRGDGPTPVVVATAAREDVPVTIEGIGTVQADASVTVRAQVEGRLLEVRFREGQDVAEGDVLAVIDPASYRAVYDQAVAKRDQDAADLQNARADLERYERLAKTESGSRQQADTQRATVAKLEALQRADQGAIDAAAVDLGNTTIKAPISGRAGLRQVDAGNLVRSTDTTGLVTIARLKPIAVTFSVPQQRLGALLAAQGRGAVAVEAVDGAGRTIDSGTVTVIDNQVDTTTGTVKVKASFANRDTRLWPGEFVDVRVAVDTLAGVTVVPSAAVQRSTDGAHVYVLGDGDKAVLRPVDVRLQDETRAVIAAGVAVGDKVVTTGFARLTDGAAVVPSEGGAAAGAAATAPGERAKRRGHAPAGGQGGGPDAATPNAATGAPAPSTAPDAASGAGAGGASGGAAPAAPERRP